MKKLNVLYRIEYPDKIIHNEINSGCEWVLEGEGFGSIKYDGSCCLIQDGKLYRRYDRKLNKKSYQEKKQGLKSSFSIEDFKDKPDGWIACESDPDYYSGHWPGWLPCEDIGRDKYHWEAYNENLSNGSYELVGPKIQNNSYNLDCHQLWRHGQEKIENLDRSFEGIREYLSQHNIEGIVFHHPDGRKCKIRRRDYSLEWNQ